MTSSKRLHQYFYNLSGTVLSDTQAPDADGIDNPGDTPIEGVTVELFADDGDW